MDNHFSFVAIFSENVSNQILIEPCFIQIMLNQTLNWLCLRMQYNILHIQYETLLSFHKFVKAILLKIFASKRYFLIAKLLNTYCSCTKKSDFRISNQKVKISLCLSVSLSLCAFNSPTV